MPLLGFRLPGTSVETSTTTDFDRAFCNYTSRHPIITAGGYIGADGKYYHTFDKSSPYYDKIMDYCYSEYNNVFDKKHLVDEFFKINDNK